MKFVETHCHLDSLKAFPLSQILERCREELVEKIITISVSPQNLETVLQLAEKDPRIFATQGVHPHEASLYNEEVENQIQENLKKSPNKIVAIGEIGLDYYYQHSSRQQQISAFEKQLELASLQNLPVVIHSRDADEDMISILKNYAPRLSRKGVIHSFTSSLQLAQCAFEEDFYLGFNGIITFKNAQNVRDVLMLTPLDKILLETDAPYLTPVPHRGKENAPYYLPFVAKYVGELLKRPLEEVAEMTYRNAHQLFQL